MQFPLVARDVHNNVTKQNIDDSERMKSQFLSLLYCRLSFSYSKRCTVCSKKCNYRTEKMNAEK
jgi:hypothetical protein